MQRIATPPRLDWPKVVESQGLLFHSIDGVPYWDESAYYLFEAREVDAIERATYELDRMCLAAVDHVVTQGRLDVVGVPEPVPPLRRRELGSRRALDLRPVRPFLRRQRPAQAPRIQRRHADLAAGSWRDPVVLGASLA